MPRGARPHADRAARRRRRAVGALHRGPRHAPDRRRRRAARRRGRDRLPVPDDRARPRRRHRPRAAAASTPAPRSPPAATRRRSSTRSRRRARSSSTSGSRPASAASTAATDLLRAATASGYAALGWPEGGRIEPGALADLTTVSLDSVRLAGTRPEEAVPSVVFAAAAADVRHVMVGGRWSVRDGEHVALDVAARAAGGARAMTALVIDDIGLLVTNDPALGEGALGLVRNAALVLEDGVVTAVERAGAAGDERIDAGGRCVIPGFVDSHTHLVFAGDRGDEFAARMAGAPYAAGGIRVTTEATRAASSDELAALAQARRREALRAGITHLEIKSGYGLDVAHRAAVVRGRRRAHRRRDVPRRPRRPRRVRGPRRRLRRARLRRHARGLRAARPLDRRLLRGRRVRRGPVARGARGRAAPPGSACASTATSSAPARACGSRSSSAPPPSTTAPT